MQPNYVQDNESLRAMFQDLRVEGNFPSDEEYPILMLSDSTGRPTKSKGGASAVGNAVAKEYKGRNSLLYLTLDGAWLIDLLAVLKVLPHFAHSHFM